MRGVIWGHFKEHAPFTEFLEAAEFIDMEISMVHAALIIHVNGDFGMAFNFGLRGSIVIFSDTIIRSS